MKTQTITPTPTGDAPSGGLFEGLLMDDIRDLRDRLARAEQNIINSDKTFASFKQDDFHSLKVEVHTMRGELNKKIDELLEKVSGINLTMAKWMGAGAVLIFIGEMLAKRFIG